MTAVAINQFCYLPCRGQFALLKAADVFVFYDDVQFTSNTSRSFFARVQLKTARGRSWLTVPVRKSGRFGQPIGEVDIDLSLTRSCTKPSSPTSPRSICWPTPAPRRPRT